jgi:hypothetical protein
MELQDFIPFLSAVFGGVVVALLNFFFAKRRTEAEIKKIEAETRKINLETASLQSKVEDVASGQQQQQDTIQNIQTFLVRHFLSAPERKHLERLSTGEYWPFQKDDTTTFFLNELRNLRSMGLIEGYPNKGIRSLLREGGDINVHFRIRPEGKDYLTLLKAANENKE